MTQILRDNPCLSCNRATPGNVADLVCSSSSSTCSCTHRSNSLGYSCELVAMESGCTGSDAQCGKIAAKTTLLLSPATVRIGAATITAPNPIALTDAVHRVYKQTYNSMGYATGPGKFAHGAPLQCAMSRDCSLAENAQLGVFASYVCQTRGLTCHGLGLLAQLGFNVASADLDTLTPYRDGSTLGGSSLDDPGPINDAYSNHAKEMVQASHSEGDQSADVGAENVAQDFANPEVGGYENGYVGYGIYIYVTTSEVGSEWQIVLVR